MNSVVKFAVGGALGLCAVLALSMAAHEGKGSAYQGGIVLFLYLVGLIFLMITRIRFDGRDPLH
jgi:hypothetical protein